MNHSIHQKTIKIIDSCWLSQELQKIAWQTSYSNGLNTPSSFWFTSLLVHLNTSCKSTALSVTRTNLIGWCKMQWQNNYPIRQCDVIGCIRPIRDTLRCITTYIVTTDLIGWCMRFCLLLNQSETKWDLTAWHPTTLNYSGFRTFLIDKILHFCTTYYYY